MKNIDTDILISGAGPSGLMLGCQLSLHSIDFMIIEKRTMRKEYSGALVIHPASLEIFARLNILEKVLQSATLVDSVNFNWKNKKILHFAIRQTDDIITSYPKLILLEQYLLEDILIEYLKSKNIRIYEDYELIDAYETDGFITTHVIKHKYNSTTITCKYLIGADGMDSIVRHLFKIPTKRRPDKKSVFIMDFTMSKFPDPLAEIVGSNHDNSTNSFDLSPNQMNFIFNDSGSFGIFPLKNGSVRIDGHVKDLKLKTSDTKSEKVIQHLPSGLSVDRVKWFSVFTCNYILANEFRSGNCFLIGDAAHSHNPVGGQGMNSGFQDAVNLGWKLAYVIKGIAHENILNSYTIERKPVVKTIMDKSTFFFNLITQKTRLHAFIWLRVVPLLVPTLSKIAENSKVRNFILNSVSQLWIRYIGPLIIPNSKANGLSPGKLYKHADLPEEFRQSVNFKLIIFGDLLVHPNYWTNGFVSVDVIEIGNTKSGNEIINRLGIRSNCFILLRPDNHIAIFGEENDLHRIKPYLKQLKHEQSII